MATTGRIYVTNAHLYPEGDNDLAVWDNPSFIQGSPNGTESNTSVDINIGSQALIGSISPLVVDGTITGATIGVKVRATGAVDAFISVDLYRNGSEKIHAVLETPNSTATEYISSGSLRNGTTWFNVQTWLEAGYTEQVSGLLTYTQGSTGDATNIFVDSVWIEFTYTPTITSVEGEDTHVLIGGNRVAALKKSSESHLLKIGLVDGLTISDRNVSICGIPICLYEHDDGGFALGIIRVPTDDLVEERKTTVWQGFRYELHSYRSGMGNVLVYKEDTSDVHGGNTTALSGHQIAMNDNDALFAVKISAPLDEITYSYIGGMPIMCVRYQDRWYLGMTDELPD